MPKLLLCWNSLSEKDVIRIQEITKAEVLVSKDKQEASRLISRIDVAFGAISPELLVQAKNLRWLQLPFAGAEKILSAPWGNPDMVITNSSGIFGPCIAEHVVGMILSFNRGLHVARDYQHLRQWQWEYSFRELTGATVGILGYGDIGVHVAKGLQGFGVNIIGIRRSPQGNEPYAQEVLPLTELDAILPRLDFLVCALPHTAATQGLLTKERLAKLQPHAVIINVGRGSLFVEEDLVEALTSGIIAGAGLDVTQIEPLPQDSPLWVLPNVLLTPHNSGQTPFHTERALEIFLDNWTRFVAGQPLNNQVLPEKGY